MKREDLDEFVQLYNPANRHDRKPTWREDAPSPQPFPLSSGEVAEGARGEGARGNPHPGRGEGAAEGGTNGRWRVYDYEALVARDKASLDIFWLRDETLADSDNLPAPEVIAQEIVDDLEAALEQFRLIAGDLNGGLASEAAE